MIDPEWELVVGLEVHVELNTVTKMWCGCANVFGGEPNTSVCPVCTGQPGALPVVNREAVTSAARLGLALNCRIAPTCRFHRKNYFYPDLAKNYQISQYDVPLCDDGWIDTTVGEGTGSRRVRVRIERVHMEEDTGKSTHLGATGRLQGAATSLIDYNRCGVPLLEVVSRPDIADPETAQAYVRELQGIVATLGVSDARMDRGSMRCDANVSVRRRGATQLGTRTETKNLNSVRSIGRAISFEAQRQVDVLTEGGTIQMETRHWDEGRGVGSSLRRKESVADYRYFPDPDLVELRSSADWVESLRATIPELPAAARDRLVGLGVDPSQAAAVVGNGMLGIFDDAAAAGADPATTANWLAGELAGQLAAAGLDVGTSGVTGAQMAQLMVLVEDETLSTNLAKQVLQGVIAVRGSKGPARVVEDEGLHQVSDADALQAVIDTVVADNPDTVATIRDGNAKAVGALVGQVMKATKGQADPQKTTQLLRDTIG